MKIDWKSFRKKWEKPDKKAFPTGSVIYKGFQGSGKTLSLVHDSIELLKEYPKARMETNVKIKTGVEEIDSRINYYENDKQLIAALGERCPDGMIVVIDEAHLFFNKKTGISLEVLTAISQQRKDRRRLMMTCQIWEDLDVSLRKQVKEVVSCKCLLRKVQFNRVSDGETIHWDNRESAYTANQKEIRIFKHYIKLYECYDTRQKITTNSQTTNSFGYERRIRSFTQA